MMKRLRKISAIILVMFLIACNGREQCSMEKIVIYSLPWNLLTRTNVSSETIKNISAMKQVAIFDSILKLDTTELSEVGDDGGADDIRILVEYMCDSTTTTVVQFHSDGRTLSVEGRKYAIPMRYFRWIRSNLPPEHKVVLPEELQN